MIIEININRKGALIKKVVSFKIAEEMTYNLGLLGVFSKKSFGNPSK